MALGKQTGSFLSIREALPQATGRTGPIRARKLFSHRPAETDGRVAAKRIGLRLLSKLDRDTWLGEFLGLFRQTVIIKEVEV